MAPVYSSEDKVTRYVPGLRAFEQNELAAHATRRRIEGFACATGLSSMTIRSSHSC